MINSERDYQDGNAKEWDHKGVPSFEAELLLLEEYIAEARRAWKTSPNNDVPLHSVRKVAGIAVRCMENHGDFEKLKR